MDFVQTFILLILPPYLAAALLYLVRAIKGPTIPDQVLAVDLLSYNLAVLFAALGVFFREPILIIAVVPLALWIYALDVYVAKYLEGRGMGA